METMERSEFYSYFSALQRAEITRDNNYCLLLPTTGNAADAADDDDDGIPVIVEESKC